MQHDYRLVMLFASFVIFSGLAIFVIFKPLQTKFKWQIIGTILFVLSIIFIYKTFGGFEDYYVYKQAEKTKQQALQLLKNLKNTNELSLRLENHLKNNPDSARGWYLLGRLYVSQNKITNALHTFRKAYKLDSKDIPITLNYAGLLLENGDEKIGVKLLEKLLQNNREQPEALSMLAMHAYKQKDFKVAVSYWRRLLNTLPEDSEEADSVRIAIAKFSG